MCLFVLRSFTQRRTLIEEATFRRNEKRKVKIGRDENWEKCKFFSFLHRLHDESFAMTFSLFVF